MSKKRQAEVKEKIECDIKAIRRYNAFINKDKKLIKWVDKLDKAYWNWKLG